MNAVAFKCRVQLSITYCHDKRHVILINFISNPKPTDDSSFNTDFNKNPQTGK